MYLFSFLATISNTRVHVPGHTLLLTVMTVRFKCPLIVSVDVDCLIDFCCSLTVLILHDFHNKYNGVATWRIPVVKKLRK